MQSNSGESSLLDSLSFLSLDFFNLFSRAEVFEEKDERAGLRSGRVNKT